MNDVEKARLDSHIAINIFRPIGGAIRAEECDSTSLHVAANEARLLAEAYEEGELDIRADSLTKKEEIAADISRITADVGGCLEALAESNNEYLLGELRGMKERIENIMEEVEHG